MSEWQPIETAPKDGTLITVAWIDQYGRVYAFSYWSRVSDEFVSMETGGFMKPTHWAPMSALPEPPVS